MFRHLRFVGLLFLALCLGSSPIGWNAPAQIIQNAVFGPVEFIRSTGVPVTETFSFTTDGYQAPFTIHLRNGDDNGQNLISSANVWLNGELLFGPRDFSKRVQGYDREVPLDASNALSVRLTSKPGSRLTIWIEGTSVGIRPEVLLDTLSSRTGLVTPKSGGMIETTALDGTKYTLIIPPDALLAEREITITPVQAVYGLPSSINTVSAVQIMPDGLALMEPATLTIESTEQIQSNAAGYLFQNNGEGFHLCPVSTAGNTVTFRLMHFTIPGYFYADCEFFIAWDVSSWITQQDRARQRIALLKGQFETCVSGGEVIRPEEVDRAMMEIHYDWFFEGVRYLIDRANTDPEAFLDLAISELNAWFFSYRFDDFPLSYPAYVSLHPFPSPVEYTGVLCSDLADIEDVASELIFSAIRTAVINANNRCISGAVANQDDEAMRLIDKACWLENHDLWGILYESVSITDSDLLGLKTCGIDSIKIDPPGATIAPTHSVQLKVNKYDMSGTLIGEVPDEQLRWFSRNESVATVEDGLVVAVSQGVAEIEARLLSSYGCVYYVAPPINVTVGDIVIETLSHPNNCYITSYEIELIGRVHDAAANGVDSITVMNGLREVQANLSATGEFRVNLGMDECGNHLTFTLFGTDSNGTKIPIGPHNYENTDYVITLVDIRTSEWALYEGDDDEGDEAGYFFENTCVFIGEERAGKLYDTEYNLFLGDYEIIGGAYSTDGFTIIITGYLVDGGSGVIESPNLITWAEMEAGGDVYLLTRERCGLPAVIPVVYIVIYSPEQELTEQSDPSITLEAGAFIKECINDPGAALSPSLITWSVFNDLGFYELGSGSPLSVRLEYGWNEITAKVTYGGQTAIEQRIVIVQEPLR